MKSLSPWQKDGSRDFHRPDTYSPDNTSLHSTFAQQKCLSERLKELLDGHPFVPLHTVDDTRDGLTRLHGYYLPYSALDRTADECLAIKCNVWESTAYFLLELSRATDSLHRSNSWVGSDGLVIIAPIHLLH
jgi:hypothetical protein